MYIFHDMAVSLSWRQQADNPTRLAIYKLSQHKMAGPQEQQASLHPFIHREAKVGLP